MWKEKHAFHLMTNIQNSALRKKKEIQRKALFIAVLTLLGKSYSDANMKWEQQACNYDHIFFIANKEWWKIGAEEHQTQGGGSGGFT